MSPLNSHLISAPVEDLHTSQGRMSFAHRAKKKKWPWRFASWNVRSMLDVEGSVEIASQESDTSHAQERKVDLVVRELNRYAIKIAALQKTKWLGSNTDNVGNSALLTAGRPVPAPGEPIQQGGVALVLTGPAITAWIAAGQQWKVDLCTFAGKK